MQEMWSLCCQMWLQAQQASSIPAPGPLTVLWGTSLATHDPSLHADSSTNSPHKSHLNPLKLGLNPQYWAWQWPMVFFKQPACSCHLATLKLLSVLPFWFLHFCHSRWTDQLVSWGVKMGISSICESPPSWLTPVPLKGQGCTLSPPQSQSSTNIQLFPPTQHPEFILCCDLLSSSPPGSPSPVTGAFRDAAKAGCGPSPPARAPAVWICFQRSCIHGPADAAGTLRHTPWALG